MSDKQTRCPNCLTLYKVSVTQLTAAQGMVCCPKCTTQFNALLHLVESSTISDEHENPHPSSYRNYSSKPHIHLPKLNTEQNTINDFFSRKIENSNIDLRTYLNTLNFVDDSASQTFPALHLATHHNHKPHREIQKTRLYYMMWTLINIALVSILSFQILWFNPNLLDRYPVLNTLFTQTCSLLRCETIDQRYRQILVQNLKVKALENNKTQFSGQLLNQFSKSLELPLIKVSLYKEGQVTKIYTVSAHEYLIESLTGIKRIPQNSPYTFKFELPIDKKSFDNWKLEIIHP